MRCELCGCTDQQACYDEVTRRPCHWLAPGLCSACEFAPIAARAPAADERQPLAPGYVLEIGYRNGQPVATRLRAPPRPRPLETA